MVSIMTCEKIETPMGHGKIETTNSKLATWIDNLVTFSGKNGKTCNVNLQVKIVYLTNKCLWII